MKKGNQVIFQSDIPRGVISRLKREIVCLSRHGEDGVIGTVGIYRAVPFWTNRVNVEGNTSETCFLLDLFAKFGALGRIIENGVWTRRRGVNNLIFERTKKARKWRKRKVENTKVQEDEKQGNLFHAAVYRGKKKPEAKWKKINEKKLTEKRQNKNKKEILLVVYFTNRVGIRRKRKKIIK